jgi:SAM-dependent methyltransferase
MAEADRLRWNDRYRAEGYEFAPAGWLASMCDVLSQHPPGARALDVACGGGRNAVVLAELGYHVDAFDISEAGLGILRAEVARRALAGEPLAIEPRQVDLERTALAVEAYDLILDTLYLERSLFAPMRHALRPGGRLLFRTILCTPGGPATSRLGHPAFALQPGELGRAFGDLEILQLVEDQTAEDGFLFGRRRA